MEKLRLKFVWECPLEVIYLHEPKTPAGDNIYFRMSKINIYVYQILGAKIKFNLLAWFFFQYNTAMNSFHYFKFVRFVCVETKENTFLYYFPELN